MAKILLVEDDNNLREIYEARLQAEGYEIVSAVDGESALVVAKKEMPDLVISDVMMPRISGFEMLDIMRNTEGLKNVKVIMLTALGQAEDKTRADTLGADKYLVKSQVTLEDIVKSAAELLGGATPAPAAPAPPAASNPGVPAPAAASAPPAPAAPVSPPPAPVAPAPVAQAAPTAPAAPPLPVVPAPRPQLTTPVPPPVPDLAPPAAPKITTPLPAPNLKPLVSSPLIAPLSPAPASAVSTAAAPVPATTSSADERLVADAVKGLIDGTPGAAQPAPPAPAPTPPTAVAPAPPNPLASPAPAPTAVPVTLAPNLTPAPAPAVPTAPAAPAAPIVAEGEDTRTKRIIKPLESGVAGPVTPDLNQLMAKEGHVLGTPAQDVTLPHQPGQVISPNPMDSTGQPEDPNKIAL